jgi:polysaccharide pyruvyl transferase WcaK-like protein
VYSQLDLVVVREPISYRRLIELGVPKEKVLVGADAAVSVSASPPSHIEAILRKEDIHPNTVGIAVRGDREVDMKAWASLADTLKQRYNKEVLFISNCLLNDAWVGNELQKQLGIKVLSTQYNYDEYLGIVSRLDAVISDRYHTNVFAIISGVPAIPIRGNTFKTDGFFELFEYPIPVLDLLNSSNLAEVVQHFDYLHTNYEAIKMELSEIAVGLRKKAEINVDFDLYSILASNLASSKRRTRPLQTMQLGATPSPVE